MASSRKYPMYPKYERYDSRLETFNGFCRMYSKYSSERFAKAGFYWTKQRDLVRCYYCGLSLTEWKPNEDPITEHAFHNPTCKYMLTTFPGMTYKYSVDKSNVDIPGTPIITKEKKVEPSAPPFDEYCNESSLSQKEGDVVRTPNDVSNKPIPAPRAIAKNHLLISEEPPKSASSRDENVRKDISSVEESIDRAMKRVSEIKIAVAIEMTKMENIQKQVTCIQCHKTYKNVMFLPCKHMYYCSNCVDESANMCLCQTPINQVLVASE